MKYSHDYSKLKNETYTTIRRHPKGKIGTITNENYPSGSHLAIIENIKRMTIDEMSISMIQQDGDVKTREEFLDLLNSFYRKPIKRNEKLYIYFLRKKNNEYKGILIETIPYGISINEDKMNKQIKDSDFLFTMPLMDMDKIKKIIDKVLEAKGEFVYIRRYCAKKLPNGDTNFGVKNLPVDYALEIKDELEGE